MVETNYKQLRMIWMKLEAFLNKQQKIHVSCQTWKSLKSFLEHNYMKSSFDFVYDLPHEFILTIKRYNLSSYEYVNIKYQQIELKWASIYPAWIEFKLAIQKAGCFTSGKHEYLNVLSNFELCQNNHEIRDRDAWRHSKARAWHINRTGPCTFLRHIMMGKNEPRGEKHNGASCFIEALKKYNIR